MTTGPASESGGAPAARPGSRRLPPERGSGAVIDVHVHLLPGLDDGPETLEESLELARALSTEGVTRAVATPHCVRGGAYDPTPERIRSGVAQLRAALQEAGIALEIHPGAEVALEPDLYGLLASGRYLTLAETGRYLLLELPADEIPPYTKRVVFDCLVHGVVPVLAHVERNRAIARDPNQLWDLVERGALAQVNASSVASSDPAVQRLVRTLLKHDLAHLVASDAHHASRRPPRWRAAMAVLRDWVGDRRAVELTVEIPAAIVEGRPVPEPNPQRVRSASPVRRVMGWLRRGVDATLRA